MKYTWLWIVGSSHPLLHEVTKILRVYRQPNKQYYILYIAACNQTEFYKTKKYYIFSVISYSISILGKNMNENGLRLVRIVFDRFRL